MSCKCVCKPWLDLLATPEFVKSHLSKSVPGLAIFDWKTESKTNKVIEFEDEFDEHCWNVVLNFDLRFYDKVHVHPSSVNGLFLVSKRDPVFFLCNPITREYIMIPPSPPSLAPFRLATYGFGVSRMSNQYKVVRIYLEEKLPQPPDYESFQYECQVCTVGSGSWTRIACDEQLCFMAGVFLNGNIHWLADNGSAARVSCLDLETELFSTLLPPPHPPCDNNDNNRTLSVMGDFLCVCDTFNYGNYGIDIWLMKEYGEEKSWKRN